MKWTSVTRLGLLHADNLKSKCSNCFRRCFLRSQCIILASCSHEDLSHVRHRLCPAPARVKGQTNVWSFFFFSSQFVTSYEKNTGTWIRLYHDYILFKEALIIDSMTLVIIYLMGTGQISLFFWGAERESQNYRLCYCISSNIYIAFFKNIFHFFYVS